MWHSIFNIGLPVFEKVIRPLLIYIFLIIALRLAGKRELGQLNMLDFIVILSVANAVQNGIIGEDVSVTGALIGASVLFATNASIASMTIRWPRLRSLVVGSPVPLVQNGLILKARLRKERLSEDDLLSAVIDAGGRNITDADLIMLAPNGKLLVELRHDVTIEHKIDAIERKLDDLIARIGKASG